jgi:hypothetical protein
LFFFEGDTRTLQNVCLTSLLKIYEGRYWFLNGTLYIYLTNSKLLSESVILIIIERNNVQQKSGNWNINVNECLGVLGQQKDLQKVLEVLIVTVSAQLMSLDERLD